MLALDMIEHTGNIRLSLRETDRDPQNKNLSAQDDLCHCELLKSGMRFQSERAFAPCTQFSLEICHWRERGTVEILHMEAVVVDCEMLAAEFFEVVVIFLEEPPAPSSIAWN